jgi:stage V sporulation protein D (sporulation-specific penicillin-binding protein)
MKSRPSSSDRRLFVFTVAVLVGMSAVAARLFVLQVLSHRFYAALASNQHSIFEELFPERGTVHLSDPKSPEGTFPAIINKNAYVVYANGRDVVDAADAARRLAPVLETDEATLFAKLSRKDDPYEPLGRKIDDAKAAQVKALDIKGIGLAREQHRYYPEGTSLSHVTGFLGSNDKGERVGRYGIEGYWNDRLAGKPGHIEAEKDPIGRWIGAAERDFQPAEDGDRIMLTIDRSIQYVTCEKLHAAVMKHGADGHQQVQRSRHFPCLRTGFDFQAVHARRGHRCRKNFPELHLRG